MGLYTDAASLDLMNKKWTDLRSFWTTSASRAGGQTLHYCCGAVSHAGGHRKKWRDSGVFTGGKTAVSLCLYVSGS